MMDVEALKYELSKWKSDKAWRRFNTNNSESSTEDTDFSAARRGKSEALC